MNKRKILKITAATMALTTLSSLNQGKVVQAVETIVNNSQISEGEINSIDDEENTSEDKDNSIEVIKSKVATGSAVVYENDFEDGEKNLPNKVNWSNSEEDLAKVNITEVDGNNVLGFDADYSSKSEWSDETSLCFFTSGEETIPADSEVTFDVIISKSDASGIIKYESILQGDWNDAGKGSGEVSLDDFEEDGDYLRKNVSIKTSVKTEKFNNLAIKFAGYNCDYKGKVYIDNVKVVKGEESDDSDDNVEIKETIIYENKFNNDTDAPNELKIKNTDKKESAAISEITTGEKALKIASEFDGTDNWDSNKHELVFYVDSSDNIPSDSIIQFDILIPKDKANYEGTIKYSGGIGDKEWNWKGAGYGEINSEDFEDEGNGYLRKTVSVKTSEESDGLKKVVVQLSGYNCEYQGDIYIDNVKLIKVEAGENQDDTTTLPTVSDMVWNFDSDAEGWSYEGMWAYKGPTDNVVNYDDKTIGSGALKLSVDYSNDSSVSWSEFKISKNLGEETSFNGYNILTYDFIYDPSKMTTGAFQTKLFISDSLNTYDKIDLTNAEDIGDGLKKAQVTLKFSSKDVSANSIILGVIGSNTDYKGDIYIDNIKLSQEQEADKYAEKIAEAMHPQTMVDIDTISMPSSVKLVDSYATSETADLYAYLKGVGKTDYVLYGHQNDTHHKIGTGSTNSDSKDLTGSISAICGIDGLSLTGDELSLTDDEKASGEDLISKAADLSIEASNEGGIITMSAHMPNFELVKKKGKDAKGNYDYSGYTPTTTTGNIVSRIMPGGDLNDVYVGYLDMVADYAHQLEEAGVPVLFRPFHENNGSWFWWGKAYCDASAYKNMYRYTVQYLRDTKNVHNFLYVYSPGATFTDESDYLSRYPGDEFIDILGFDMYDTNPTEDASTDPWMKSFKGTVDLVSGLANKRGKLSAVTEAGLSPTLVSGNVDKDWFSNVSNIISKSDMSYYMTWANFDEGNFFAPYMVSDTKGHEMINNFIDYYNEEESVFADGVGKYADAETTKDSAYTYGFITGPVSSSRILEPAIITASVKGYDGEIKFVLKNKSGESVETLDATSKDSVYSAEITQAILDKLGETIGSIELYSDDTLLDSIKAIFNIKEAEKDPKLVDNFESYSGEDSLLQNTWATNYGADCSITPTLDANNKNSGDYGLAFNYNISAGGYAGITQALDVDWSDCDALQIWIKPDGKGQKLVIQLTSNGEDFEVWMSEFAATTEAKLITIPFSELKGKNNGTFDPAHIEKMGIWCNTVGSETVNSTMYFDDIKAINTSESGIEVGKSYVSVSGVVKVGYTLTPAVKIEDKYGNDITDSLNLKYYWYQMNNNEDQINDTNSKLISTDETYKIVRNDYSKYIRLVVKYVNNEGEEKEILPTYTTAKVTFKSSGHSSSSSSSSSSDSSSSDKDDSNKNTDNSSLNNNISNNSSSVEIIKNEDGTVQTKLVNNKGEALSGWQLIDNKWYLGDENGVAKTDWQQVNGIWYYLESNGQMKTGWFKDTNDTWYYLQSSGAMQTGWLKDNNGKWYYMQENGAMKTGWFKDTNATWYYLNSKGEMETGWLKDNEGKWYYLDQSGAMVSDDVVDGYALDKNGAWIQ